MLSQYLNRCWCGRCIRRRGRWCCRRRRVKSSRIIGCCICGRFGSAGFLLFGGGFLGGLLLSGSFLRVFDFLETFSFLCCSITDRLFCDVQQFDAALLLVRVSETSGETLTFQQARVAQLVACWITVPELRVQTLPGAN